VSAVQRTPDAAELPWYIELQNSKETEICSDCLGLTVGVVAASLRQRRGYNHARCCRGTENGKGVPAAATALRAVRGVGLGICKQPTGRSRNSH